MEYASELLNHYSYNAMITVSDNPWMIVLVTFVVMVYSTVKYTDSVNSATTNLDDCEIVTADNLILKELAYS